MKDQELHEMNSDKFPRKGSSGGGSSPAYSVEARLTFGKPTKIGDTIFHKDWQRVNFTQAPDGFGVPGDPMLKEAHDRGLLAYPQAQALRWWFHAQCRNNYGLETRILKHLITYSHQETIVGEFDHIGGESSNYCRPDFEKTQS